MLTAKDISIQMHKLQKHILRLRLQLITLCCDPYTCGSTPTYTCTYVYVRAQLNKPLPFTMYT